MVLAMTGEGSRSLRVSSIHATPARGASEWALLWGSGSGVKRTFVTALLPGAVGVGVRASTKTIGAQVLLGKQTQEK